MRGPRVAVLVPRRGHARGRLLLEARRADGVGATVPACPRTPPAPDLDPGKRDCRFEGDPAGVFIPGASRHAADWDAVHDALSLEVKTSSWEPPRQGGRDARVPGRQRAHLEAAIPYFDLDDSSATAPTCRGV